MSENNKNKNTKGGEGEYKVPGEVWEANWHDDVPEEKDETTNVIEVNFNDFKFFKNEARYQNDPSDDEEGVEEKIKEFQRKKMLGQKVLSLYKMEGAA